MSFFGWFDQMVDKCDHSLSHLSTVYATAFPYRTPSVNQYWAIVNASLPCNIISSLSRLKFASFKRIRTAQKTFLQQLRWCSKEDKDLRRWREWVRSPYATLFSHLYLDLPSLTSLKSVMIIALNQYWYLDLELDLPSTDIDLALSTGSTLYFKLN